MSMTQENLDRLNSVLDGIHTNLESQSTQIKCLAELLQPSSQSSTGQAPQEPLEKDDINRDLGNESTVSESLRVRSVEDGSSRATSDIQAQVRGDEGEPKPSTPPTIFYPAGIKTQYTLGQLPMVYQLQEKTASLARGEEWAYWRPVFDGHKLLAGQAQPNFVPEWEICYDNGQPYHIDDHEPKYPLPGAPGPDHNPSSTIVELLVPYSCSPPPTNYSGYFPQKGFGELSRRVREVLGDLCRIPSDGRAPPTCEAYILRERHMEGRLTEELQTTNTFLSKLESKGGEFSVYDIDDYGNFFRYRRQTVINADLKFLCWSDEVVKDMESGMESQKGDVWNPQWSLTRSYAERISLKIPPIWHRMEKTTDGWRHSESPVVEVQPWYRIVYLKGCERLGAKGNLEGFNKSLFHVNTEFMRQYSPFSHAIYEHLRPNGTKFAPITGLPIVNHFITWPTTPFQVVWLRMEAEGLNEDNVMDSLWHRGPLDGDAPWLVGDFHGKRQLTQHAITVSILQQITGSNSDGSPIRSPYYTILLLSEPGRVPPFPPLEHMHPNIHSWRPVESVLYFIDDALSRASFDWIPVEEHIDRLTQHDATIIFCDKGSVSWAWNKGVQFS